MDTNNGTNGNGRIEFLKQKEREIRARLAAEQVKQQKAKEKLLKREFSAVGEVLCKCAAESREIHSALEAMLCSVVMTIDEATKRFLVSRGWGL